MATNKKTTTKARSQGKTQSRSIRARSLSNDQNDQDQKAKEIAVLLEECEARKLTKPEKVAVLMAQGMSRRQARIHAGIKGNGTPGCPSERKAMETVDQARARLAQQKGYLFGDSVEFYGKMSKNTKQTGDTRIRARTRLDSLLGYDAPAKQEIVHRQELRSAIMVLSRLDISPADMLADGDVSDMCTVQEAGAGE